MITPDVQDPRSDLYWSVVLRHRWARWFDDPELWMVSKRAGRLDGPSVRRIAGMYSVARGLRLLPADEAQKDRDLDEALRANRAQSLADTLNEIFAMMPEGMVERAHYLLEAHDKIAEYVHNRQLSALSKFAWFAKPQGWTMFDSLASKALGVASYQRFYARLVELKFSSLVAGIDEALAQEEAKGIHSERVVDQFLLLRASAQPTGNREVALAYLSSLPSEVGCRLHRDAAAVATAVDKHELVQTVR